jgi:NAD(P)-dependent dehydrogenase (short-subunit alcohol dehydrogenase family)
VSAPRTVLVTGASSGIGRATALRLARAGDNLVLVSRSPDVLAEVAADCAREGAKAIVAEADVADAQAVDAAFERGGAEFGAVDGVVHSAAVLAYGRFEDVPTEVFDRALVVNVLGTANVARAALHHFRSAGGGTLVVVGSVLGRVSVPLLSGYATSKWAVHGLVRALQIEARRTPGIRIGLVSPGGVDTPIYLQAGTYLSRHGRPPPPVDSPEKVARVVVRSLDDPKRDASVGAANGVMSAGFRWMPGVFDLLVTPLMEVAAVSRDAVANSSGNVFDPLPEGEGVHGQWGRHWLRPVGGAAALAVTDVARRLMRQKG